MRTGLFNRKVKFSIMTVGWQFGFKSMANFREIDAAYVGRISAR